jgi:hypothetical protein
MKCYLQQYVSHQATPGMMQISVRSSALDMSRYWQIWILNIHFGVAKFPTLRARNYWIYCNINEFEISAPHYSPARNGDVLDIVVHKNTRLSETVGSHIMVGHHLRLSNVLERISGPSCGPLYPTNTSNRKQEIFMNNLRSESFCPQNRTLVFDSTLLKHGRHFDYWNQPTNMRMSVWYLDCHKGGLCCYT